MPPKNEKKTQKKQKSKALPENQYTLLSSEEMRIKELKYSNRLTDIRKCLNFINDAIFEISEINEQQLLQDKWLDYVSCNPLPKPYIPPDIRLFYSKLEYIENESKTNTINWLLSVDERSLLSQDIYRHDMTRRKLNKEVTDNLGQEYNGYIEDSLKILKNIESFLDNDVEVRKCPINILNDIVGRIAGIQEEIMEFLDRYTYRIISSENAQMKSIDAIAAEYCHVADKFQIHLCCLKNVPLRISHLSEPRLLANFYSIKLLLHIPSNMLRENLVIRAIRMDFDHLSLKANSFQPTVATYTENLSAGIVNLHECLINEWVMQLEVQDKIRNEMIAKRLAYEEKLKEFEQRMEKKKSSNKEKNNSKRKSKSVMTMKEPPLIDSETFPDTYEAFLEVEQKEYKCFVNTVYSPELLNLTSDEINLRKYCIIGGIYQLYYVEKPISCDMNSFSMTWHLNNCKLLTDKNVTIPASFESNNLYQKYLKHSELESPEHLTKRMSLIDVNNEKEISSAECPWFVVTIELPEYLCYWGEPISCHFETTYVQKQKEFEGIEPNEVIKMQKSNEKTKTQQSNLSTIVHKSQPNISISMDIPTHTTLASFTQPDVNSHFTPRVTTTDSFVFSRQPINQRVSHASFYNSSMINLLLKKSKYGQEITDSVRAIFVNDFYLTHLLTISQIRHMERHIIPRIISSYKFPKEIRQEELELYSKKPKGRGGKIIRRKTKELPKFLSNRQFTFTPMQSNPERMFVKYPKVKPLHVISHLKNDSVIDEQEEPETFAQLLQVVSDIKHKSRLRMRQTLDLKPIDSEIKTYNKRIKQMQIKKELLSIKSTLHSTISSRQFTKRTTEKSLDIDRKSKQSRSSNITEMENLKPDKILEAADLKDNLPMKKKSEPFAASAQMEPESISETCSHWTTKYILQSEFDRQNHRIVIHTNRLGNFGFAFKRYEHFPFKYWSMEPSENVPDNEVVFTLDTKYVRCVLYITANGIRGHVTEPSKTYIRNPKMYLVIEKPVRDFKKFKKLLQAKHLNIFAEHDASFYIENGYFSEKHLSNEMHTYCCMAIHSTQIKFNFSQWNRLAKRRDIILHFQHYKDLEENLVEVRLMPGEAYYVKTQELCSDDLYAIKLDYNLTWRNIESYSDLHHLIIAMYPAATDLRCKNPQLICCIRDLLSEIRPLSFS